MSIDGNAYTEFDLGDFPRAGRLPLWFELGSSIRAEGEVSVTCVDSLGERAEAVLRF